MKHQPVGGRSQCVNGKPIITMRANNHPSLPQSLNLNGFLLVKPVILTYRKNVGNVCATTSEPSTKCQALQVYTNQQEVQMKSPPKPNVRHLAHDHDYCLHPTFIADSDAIQHSDHDYCVVVHSSDSEHDDSTFENDSGAQFILPHSENPIESLSEEATARIHNNENGLINDGTNCQTNSFQTNGYDYILPDVARDFSTCNNHSCVADLAFLRSQLEQKSIDLEACLKELDDAKEHISNLRAQLEENTHAMCAYLAMGGQHTS